MRNITYKYNRGDRVCFKDKYPPSASCGLLERVGTTAVIAERSDYNGPSYKLVGVRGWFKESCFAGLATEPVGSTCRDEAVWADTLQGPETKCDTEGFKEV
jgi:hypothetical protein